LQQGGVLQDLVHQFLGTGLAVHIGHQIGQLGTRLQQLAQWLHLAGHGGGREIVQVLEGDVDAEFALAGQGIGHPKGGARLHRLHPLIEIVDVDFQELALRDRCQRVSGLAGQVGHYPHDEGQLDLFLGTVDLDIVFDLDARARLRWMNF
jgi:hypothetical protein